MATFSIQKENDVLAESFISTTMRGEHLDDFVGQWYSFLTIGRFMRCDHKLFVED